MSPRLSIIPAGAVTDHALEPRDLQVLCLLGRHIDQQGWCSRSQVKMADELNCGRATVQRSLERLYDAGWVQKKRRGPEPESTAQPSSSYAYRVILDRDDAGNDNALRAKHGNLPPSDAVEDEGCPPMGTPEGAQPDGHPGAHPSAGTGAHTYTGTKNDPLERPPVKRERDARARDVEEFLTKFRPKWPTSAADDQQRLIYAAHELTPEERETALVKIDPFLALLKSLKRTSIPAGWKFLEEKRWTLLEQQPEPVKSQFVSLDPRQPDGVSVLTLHIIAKAALPFRLANGQISFRGEVTPQLLALANAPPRDQWLKVNDRQQLGAWTAFFEKYVSSARGRLDQDSDGPWLMAPWRWPPRVDGSLAAGNEVSEEMT